MADNIGQLIKKVAESRGFSQKEFGEKINLTKQGVASIYKRETIDVELLRKIVVVLNFDFFAYYYEREPLLAFKQQEINDWQSKIDGLSQMLTLKDDLLIQRQELVETQRKLITELEEKIKRNNERA